MAAEPQGSKRSPIRRLVIGVLTSFLLSVFSSFLLGHYLSGDTVWPGYIIGLMWLASFAAAAVFVALAIGMSFRGRHPIAEQVWVILVSYVGGILVFGGLYFSMALMGDRQYAAAHYNYYRNYADSFANEVAAGQIAVVPFDGRDRAFAGIESRLWGTLDDDLPLTSLEFQKNPQAYRVSLARKHSFKDVAVFKPKAFWDVFLDCQHLSVMTMATVGYGNISPNAWYAKLATNLEALTGTSLLVVALALLLGRHSRG